MTESPAITIDPPVVRPTVARRLGRPRIWEAMASFAAVVGCYWVYWFLAVPLVEPTVAEKTATLTPEEMVADARTDITARQREVGKFFPTDSWEQQGPAIWQSDAMGMRLLFKTFTPKPDGTVEFRPCTLMLFPKQNGKPSTERPIIMRAPAGMDVKFDKKVGPKTDWGALQFEAGRLLGAIRIYQLPSAPGATDDLEITTRDVEMQGPRAFTPPQVPVNFRLGRSQGTGSDLEILLGDLEGAPPGGGMMRGMALRSLSLKRDVRMRLEMGAGALGGPAPKPVTGQPQTPIEITCQGPFRYEMEDNAASFHDNVDVLRMNSSGESDQLNCAVLTVYFAARGEMPAEPAPPTAPPGSAPAGATPASFQVRMISARGKPVTIRSPAQAMYARCDGIDYVPGPAGAPGSLVALGPGVINGNLPKDAAGKYSARWARELRFEPEGPLQRATLRGTAEIRFGIMGTIVADEIFAWLSRKPPATGPQQTSGQPSSEAWQIERMLAQRYPDPKAESRGLVVIDSPQLHASTVQLAATVHRPPVGAPLPQDPLTPGSPANPKPPTAPRPINPAERFDVHGRTVHIDLLAIGEQLAVSGATIEHDAQLKQQASPERSILVKGDKMHVTEAHTPATRVTITGRPAFVDAGGMSLWGKTIDLEKSTNRLWVNGDGRMAMPVTQGLDGQAIKQPTQLTVEWRKRMEFQSQTAVFEGGVKARSQHQVLNTEVLEATLTQPIDFSNPQMGQNTAGRPAARPELASVRTHGLTFLESKQLDEQGAQTSFSQMELHDLSVDRVTGEIGGVGPGWVHHVARGSSPQMLGPQAASPQLGQPVALQVAPAVKDEGFTYLSVTFRRKLEGNLNRRVLRFLDKTRTVYGPVASWNDKLQPNDLESLGPNGIVLDAHTLEVREMNKRPNSKRGWFELDATGDVMALGQRLTAQGERLTYSEEKDQMVLRGDPAEIFVENENGGGRQETRAREVRYWFTRNYASASGVTGSLVLPNRTKDEK